MLRNVMNKTTQPTDLQREIDAAREQFTRSQITPIGQIQLRAIGGEMWGKQVTPPDGGTRAANLLEELGIKYIGGLSNNFAYPIISGASAWVEDGETCPDAVCDSVKMQPRRLLSRVTYSGDVILNPDGDVETAIQHDLIASIGEKVQGTMLAEFAENANTTITDVSDLVGLEQTAATNKIVNGVYVVSPTAAAALKVMKNGDTPIMVNGQIFGHRVIESASLEGGAILYGDWSKVLLAQWAGLDIMCDNVTRRIDNAIRLIINSYWNWAKLDDNAIIPAAVSTD